MVDLFFSSIRLDGSFQMRIKQLIGMVAVCCGSVAMAEVFPPDAPNAPKLDFLAVEGGVLTFNGEIAGVACTAGVDGGGPDGVIALEQRHVSDFPNVGDTHARTQFSITVDCATQAVVPPQGAWTRFHDGNINAVTGRLDNMGSAKGIDLQLTDSMGGPINVHSDDGSQTEHVAVAYGDETGNVSASLLYGVEYYRNGTEPVAPGTVTATAHYTVLFD